MSKFEENIRSIYDEKGLTWLENLPALIAEIAQEYKLSELRPFKNLSYNYVLSGFQKDKPIILKLGIDKESFKKEAEALKAFSDFGVPKLLSQKSGMILQARAVPGHSLKSFFPDKDFKALKIFAKVLKELHIATIPKTHEFPHVKDWLQNLEQNWDISNLYLEKGRALSKHLLKSFVNDCLLHGDLHHENILQDGDHWIAIDPKGVIGDPVYDLCAFIRNPLPELGLEKNFQELLGARITSLAQILNLDFNRILSWSYVQAILAWTWAIEDDTDQSYFKKLTEALDGLNF